MNMNSAMLHSCLEQEAKKNALTTATGSEVYRVGCYCLDWTLARASANALAKIAVGFLMADKVQTRHFTCNLKYKMAL